VLAVDEGADESFAVVLVPDAGVVAAAPAVFAAVFVLPAAAAELAGAAVVAASEVFDGPSSARASAHAIAAIAAATHTPLRHPKHIELNCSFIRVLASEEIVELHFPGLVSGVDDGIMTNCGPAIRGTQLTHHGHQARKISISYLPKSRSQIFDNIITYLSLNTYVSFMRYDSTLTLINGCSGTSFMPKFVSLTY